MPNKLAQSLVSVPDALHLRDTALVMLRLPDAADFGQEFDSTLFDRAERDEIEAIATATRRREKIAGKVAAKIVARAVTQQWFGAALPLPLFQVLSPGSPVRVAVPTHPQLDAMLSLLRFSISHSGTLVAAAASRRRVGIDIEQLTVVPTETMRHIASDALFGDLSQYAESAADLGPAEISAAQQAAVTAFTLKEAVLKAAGIGLGEGLDDVDLMPMRLGNMQRATHRGVTYEVVSVLDKGYAMSLACVDELPRPLAAAIAESQPVLPSFGQEALYMLAHLDGIGSAFALAWRQRLLGPLDAGAVGQALQYLVNRHDALRWRFGEQEGRIVARVLGAPIITPRLVDLTSVPLQEAHRRIEELSQETLEQRFDLVAGPLLRCVIVRVSDTESELLFCFHHSVMDASSALAFRREFATAYNAFAAGKRVELPPLPFQYADFTRRQREALTTERRQKLLAYWQDVMADCPASLPLGAPLRANEKRTYQSRQLAFEISAALRNTLQDVAKAEGVTQFVIALAAYQLLLMELGSQEDFSVGVPFAGREHSEEFAVVGYFVNVLPVRSALVGASTVREVLQGLREAVMGAFEHQDLPLAELVKALNPLARSAHAPLFQSVFRLVHEYPDGSELRGLEQAFTNLPPRATLYDLNLLISLGETGGQGLLECNAAAFDRASALRIVERYQALLTTIASHPDWALRDVIKGVSNENAALQYSSNDTWRDIPNRRVETLFAAQANRTPAAVAVETPDQTLSYAELEARANRLVHYLTGLGVRPGDRVGLAMGRTPDLVVVLLAILKAGGAYVPLDPDYPADRLAFMSRDCALKVIVSLQAHLDTLAPTGARVVCMDRDRDEIGRQAANPPDCPGHPDDPAYVMYTSGSTGNPKGVVTPHRGIVRLLFGVDYVQLDAQQVFLQLGPVGFDASTFEIWGALLHGGRCVLYPDHVPTAAKLSRFLRRHRITTSFLTTALFNTLIDEAPEILRGVRQLLFGGEKVSSDHVRRALKALPQTRLIHCYGPTEATTFSTTHAVSHSIPEQASTIPIGKPIANTRVHLLDERQAPVAEGEIGEIHIGGIGLAIGYLNQPELTAEKFVADPFSAGPDARLYKTGDLARRLPDGNIEFVGRKDNQVKVRGFRIELEEIEDALMMHPSVMEVAVVPVINAQRQTRLVAYLRLRGKGQRWVAEIRNDLRARLPAQFVPDLFISLPALPRNEHNKIDRNALLQRPITTNYDEQGLNGPRDTTDLMLLEIWDELLGVSVGIDDDFFEAGGNSLLAISLLARIEKRTGRSLPLSTLFSRTTIRALSEALIHDLMQDAQGEIIELHKGTGGRPLFFMHGDFMGGFFSKDIASAADLPGPFVVMQPYDSSSQQELPPSIAAMATAHLRTMRKKQPKGPYRLAGYCNGSLIAFEMAQQLVKEGEEVEFLGLIDPSHPFIHPPQVFGKESTERFLGRYSKATDLSRLLVEDAEYRSRLLNHFSEVCAAYRADPFHGNISLLLIEERKGKRDPMRAWKKVARNVDVYQYQGERAFHGAAPRQHAGWLGQSLRRALDRLEGNVPTAIEMSSE